MFVITKFYGLQHVMCFLSCYVANLEFNEDDEIIFFSFNFLFIYFYVLDGVLFLD